MIRAPKFWHKPSIAGKLLSPLSILWRTGTAVQKIFSSPPWSGPVPIICVGNLTAGGAGKTPLTIDFVQALNASGHKPHVLTRGFGGSLIGPVKVNPDIHTVAQVGDEPLLLASKAPTWLARNRVAGAQQAIKNGASIIIMDDGFQNSTIKKSFSILAVDGGYGFGNGQVIPAGPLRETPKAGFSRCDAVVLIGEDQHGIMDFIGNTCPIYRTKIITYPNKELTNQKVIAFAGIGRPSKFYESVIDLGCEIVDTFDFPDHHQFKLDEINSILKQSSELSAIPVTTTKDYVRLPLEVQPMIKQIEIALKWEHILDRETIISRVLQDG